MGSDGLAKAEGRRQKIVLVAVVSVLAVVGLSSVFHGGRAIFSFGKTSAHPAITTAPPTPPRPLDQPPLQEVQQRMEHLANILQDAAEPDRKQFMVAGDTCPEVDIKFNGWIRQFDCTRSATFERYKNLPGLNKNPYGVPPGNDARGRDRAGTGYDLGREGAHIPHALLPAPDGEMLQFNGWRIDTIAFDMFFSHPRPKRDGVFVEFGAEDGVKVSNTIFFEKYLDWSGLLIEPSPSCVRKLEKYRPRSTVLQNAVCKEGHPPITNYFTCAHEERKEAARCVPLQKTFDANGVTHVDFLSVDCEGCELDAIMLIDFSKTTVDVIVAEWRKKDGTQRSEYLAQHGYASMRLPFYETSRVGFVTDEIFWHKDRVRRFIGK